jgi:outer membrane receptor protein involved in Fe transport
MIKISLLRCVIILCLILTANNLPAQNKKRENTGKGTIKGILKDKETRSPIESAVIRLLTSKDSILVTGTETAQNGEFKLAVPYGSYKLKISYIGYHSLDIDEIEINARNSIRNLDTLFLNSNNTSTKEIEVTAEEDFMKIAIDKKIFNVEKSLITQGGTATDVLKNIPSVTVDADGNVSLRGSTNVRFLINGKQSGIIGNDPANSLQQIPSSSIERVEIMDNPSAKFEPDGMSGIINIIMKKTDESGYRAGINLNTGVGDKYNASFNFNYKNKKFNIFGSENLRYFNMSGTGVSFRQNNFSDSLFYFDQDSKQRFNMQGNMGTLGFDYFFNDKNSLSLTGTYNDRSRSSNETINFRNLDNNQILTSQYTRNNYGHHSGKGFDLNLNFNHKFNKPKEDITASLFFSTSNDNSILNINQQNYFPDASSNGNPFLQNTSTDGKFTLGTLQLDYFLPFGNANDDSKLELGYKGTIRNTSSDFKSETYDYSQNSFISDALLNNNFSYKEQIHSFYNTYSGNYKDFKYQIGLRVEMALTTSNLITTNESSDNNYISSFPSFYISQKFLKTNEIQLNYSRRINRPNMFMLNPFIDYSDPYNLRKGNPNLKPEYINSFQVGFVKYFNVATVTSSLFYRQINDVVSHFTTVNSNGISLTTFENLNSAKSYGLEFITSAHPFKWWNFNANFSYFRMLISGSDVNSVSNSNDISYSAKFTSNFSIFNLFDFQVFYNFMGPRVSAQDKMNSVQSFDFAIRKNLFNNRGSIGLRVSDLFNQFKFSNESSGIGFIQTMTRSRESRVVFLTFSYSFGSDGDKQRDKKKPMDENDNYENMENQ